MTHEIYANFMRHSDIGDMAKAISITLIVFNLYIVKALHFSKD